jgi:hypothetical protein
VTKRRLFPRIEANLDRVVVRINLYVQVTLVETELDRHEPGRVARVRQMHDLGQIGQHGRQSRGPVMRHREIMASTHQPMRPRLGPNVRRADGTNGA